MTERWPTSTPADFGGGLVKTFGATRALDGLDLVVEQAEVHGFLGPNEAGKTTTIRLLLGLLRPTPVASPSSAVIRGTRQWSCTGGWPTCRAT